MATVIMDFDKTVADTFLPSPNGIGVERAYEVAVEECFGVDALKNFRKTGGLKNRAPGEVVAQFNGGESSVELTQNLVRAKLACLINEIGKTGADGRTWPPIYPGFAEFLRRLDDMQWLWAVLSSGHGDFIRKTFAVHSLPRPRVFSDDEASRLPGYPCKPNPVLLEVACQETGISFQPEEMMYIGDDPVKDGGLAKNAGLQFGWFAPDGVKSNMLLPAKSFVFNDWQILANLMRENAGTLKEGVSLAELFTQL